MIRRLLVSSGVVSALVATSLLGSVPAEATATDNYTPETAFALETNGLTQDTWFDKGPGTPDSACGGGAGEAWFTITPPKTGLYAIGVESGQSIDIFSGSPGALDRLTCVTLGGPLGVIGNSSSRLAAQLQGSATYYVRASSSLLNWGYIYAYRVSGGATSSTDVPYTGPGGAASLAVRGPLGFPDISIDQGRTIYLSTKLSDASVLTGSRLELIMGDRVCSTQTTPSDMAWYDGTSTRPLVEFAIDAYGDYGNPCDPDREMDGGTYDMQLFTEPGAPDEIARTTLGPVDVRGPNGVIQAEDPDPSQPTLIDYDATRDFHSLGTRFWEQWTDGSWSPAHNGSVYLDDVSLEYSTDGGTSWVDEPLNLAPGQYVKQNYFRAVVEPREDALWRFTTTTTPYDFSGTFVSVVSSLDRYTFTPVKISDGSNNRDDRYLIKTSVRQLFEDGQWRPPKQSPYRVQFRIKGTSEWRSAGGAKISDRGDVSHSVLITRDSYWRVLVNGHASARSVLGRQVMRPPLDRTSRANRRARH